ncbi:tetratricopeptide repeat protein [Dictyobacter kobayashii]|uniref:tetratricopeptide repeat protein n=1 Tax=Dictyobacter kobayashii TaxID=2014872 RepID=UPI0013871ADC|nr:tetratricopeptide repeat protein [Dictyobacter kobayashii]
MDDSATSHSLLGELLMSLDRNEDARAEFMKSQELLPPDNQDIHLEASIEAGLGNVSMRQQKFEDAIPHYQRVAEILPDYTGIWFSLGFANRLLGRLDEAETYYQRALKEEATDVRIYSELTAIYMQRAETNKAQLLLENALRQYPETAYLHALLASVLAEKGDRRQAQRHLEEAERIDPESDFIPAVRQQIATTRKRV